MRRILEKWMLPILCVLAVAIFPVAFMYCTNAAEASFVDTIEPLAVFCAVSLGVFALCAPIMRSPVKAAIAASLFSLCFTNFALLENGLKLIFPQLKYWHTVPIVFVIWLHIEYLIWKLLPSELCGDIVSVLTIVMTGLIVFNGATSIPAIIEKMNAQQELKALKAAQQETVSAADADMPNFYMLVFDEYAGFRQMEEYYGYDNAVLKDFLEKNNFTISYDSHNESIMTSTKIDFQYDQAVASIKVGKAVKSEGELIISGTKGYLYMPAPWWKANYFEIRYENPADNQRYFFPVEGEGIRYELVSFIKSIETERDFSNVEKVVTMAISDVIESYQRKKDVIEII